MLRWQLRWVGYSNNKLLSGICSKTSYCQQILQLQQIKKIKFMPDNKITRYYYNCDYSIKISTNFFHSLNSLLSIDNSIVTALTIYLQTHNNPGFRFVLFKMAQSISAGNTLSIAMLEHKAYFSPLSIQLISLGERAQKLNLVLPKIVKTQNSLYENIKKIKASCSYPLLLLTISLLVIIFFLYCIIPVFADILVDIGANIPNNTKNLITLASFLQTNISFFIISPPAILTFNLIWPYSTNRKLTFKPILKYLPMAKHFNKLYFNKYFCETLAILIKSELDIIKSLNFMLNNTSCLITKSKLSQTKAAIKKGNNIAAACKKASILPPSIIIQLEVAEQTNNLSQTLEALAETFDQETAELINKYRLLIEPCIIIIVGIIIGFVIFNLYLPILEMPLAI
ncbi:MAG: hypothetical protein HON55_03235 [Legionellales bacterium]|nr:hypothetical protein [Legionellales bacterium]